MLIYMCCHYASPPANSLTCAAPQVDIIYSLCTALGFPVDHVPFMFHHGYCASVEHSHGHVKPTVDICSKDEGIASGAEKEESR